MFFTWLAAGAFACTLALALHLLGLHTWKQTYTLRSGMYEISTHAHLGQLLIQQVSNVDFAEGVEGHQQEHLKQVAHSPIGKRRWPKQSAWK